jgi:hypothetical protein
LGPWPSPVSRRNSSAVNWSPIWSCGRADIGKDRRRALHTMSFASLRRRQVLLRCVAHPASNPARSRHPHRPSHRSGHLGPLQTFLLQIAAIRDISLSARCKRAMGAICCWAWDLAMSAPGGAASGWPPCGLRQRGVREREAGSAHESSTPLSGRLSGTCRIEGPASRSAIGTLGIATLTRPIVAVLRCP